MTRSLTLLESLGKLISATLAVVKVSGIHIHLVSFDLLIHRGVGSDHILRIIWVMPTLRALHHLSRFSLDYLQLFSHLRALILPPEEQRLVFGSLVCLSLVISLPFQLNLLLLTRVVLGRGEIGRDIVILLLHPIHVKILLVALYFSGSLTLLRHL